MGYGRDERSPDRRGAAGTIPGANLNSQSTDAMITLVKGQPVPDSDYVVTMGGEYEPTDLVDCSHVETPDEPLVRYHALYIDSGVFP